MKRFIIATILLASTLSFSVSPTQAATYPIISGRVVDVNGNPVSGMMVQVSSQGLITSSCSNDLGKYELRTRPNRTATIQLLPTCSIPGQTLRFSAFYQSEQVAISSANLTRNYNLPAEVLNIHMTLKDTYGSLVSGQITAQFTQGFAFEGTGSSYDAYLTDTPVTLNSSGEVWLYTFKASQDTVAPGCPSSGSWYCNLLTGPDYPLIVDADGDGFSDGIAVQYKSSPGVLQTIYVHAIEWTTGHAEVVFDAVPEISVSTPASVSANKTSYATASISPSLLTGLRSVATSSNQPSAAAFAGKTVKLYSRTVLGTNKYGKWAYEGSCKLSSAGKCKAKFKISKKSQLVFRATDFALPIKTKTVKIKK